MTTTLHAVNEASVLEPRGYPNLDIPTTDRPGVTDTLDLERRGFRPRHGVSLTRFCVQRRARQCSDHVHSQRVTANVRAGRFGLPS